jgi:hypothetical protein
LLPKYSGKRYSRFIWCEVIELVGLVLCGRIGFDWLVWKKILDRVGLYVGLKVRGAGQEPHGSFVGQEKACLEMGGFELQF